MKWIGPILEALKALNGSATPKEISKWNSESYQRTDEVINERYGKSGTLKFPNQLAWARQYTIW